MRFYILGEKDGGQTGNGPRRKEKKKKRKREENLLAGGARPPFAVCHLRFEFSRATLHRVSYYLTLPYGFPLNREHCSVNFIKATSLPPLRERERVTNAKVTARLSSLMPRVPRVPRNFSSRSSPTDTHARISLSPSFLLAFAFNASDRGRSRQSKRRPKVVSSC